MVTSKVLQQFKPDRQSITVFINHNDERQKLKTCSVDYHKQFFFYRPDKGFLILLSQPPVSDQLFCRGQICRRGGML